MNEKLSKLFFNIDVTQLNNSLLNKFLLDTSLHKTSETIDTVFYPSRNENVKYFIQHNFIFNENNFIKTRFIDGNLGVISGKDNQNNDFTILSLAIEFTDSITLYRAYHEVINQFKDLGKFHSESDFSDGTHITDDICQKKIEVFITHYAMKLRKYILYIYLKNQLTNKRNSLAQVSRPVPTRYLSQKIKLPQKQSTRNFHAQVKNLDKKEQFKIHFLYLQTDN